MERSLLAPGHRACAGCAMPTTIRLVLDAAGPNTIVVSPTGCLEVVTTPFPESAWCVPWIHSLFENPAAVASGVEVMLKRRGRDTNVVVIGGDGSTFDIGMGSNSGMFERGHKVLYVCYDNEAYMNTGVQRSSATPWGAWTTTTPATHFKGQEKKNIMEIMAAHRIPYAATASISMPEDLMAKVERARDTRGTRFLHIFCPCPTGWRSSPDLTIELARAAVESRAFPLYEIFDGAKRRLSLDPAPPAPVADYIRPQGRFRHLDSEQIEAIQKRVDEEWLSLLRLIENNPA